MPEHDAQSMKPRRLHVLGFLEEIRHIHETMPERRFCFILGAGASKASGIPTAGELGREWLRWTHKKLGGKPEAFGEWLGAGSHGIPGLSPQTKEADLGAFASAYPAIYKATWGHDPAQGQAELERHIEGKKPSYGYYALAGVMTDDKDGHPSRHNVVITPNFDNLPAEALGAMGRKVPIIIGHGAIAEYARPTLKRPLIVKFHHDYLLSPKSDPEEVCDLDQRYAKALAEIFRVYTPIVVGYGGNDGSLMKLLQGLPPRSIPGGLQWCWRQGEPPSERIECLVAKQGGALVEISGFDELMALLQKSLGREVDPNEVELIWKTRVEELREAHQRLFKNAEQAMSPEPRHDGSGAKVEPPTATKDQSAELSALLDTLSRTAMPAWWYWQDRVNATDDLDEKDKLYQEALAAIPKSARLLGNYALFLATRREQFDSAEEFFRMAIEADPNDARNLGNYANFLANLRGDFDRAEEHYRRAIKADSKNARLLGNYAVFLATRRGELDGAEKHFQMAVEADPKSANWLGAYAVFLENQRGESDRAEEYYRRAIEIDPKNANNIGNYALFLATRRAQFDRAEEFFRMAIEADPKDARNLGNFAVFLANRREQIDRAEELYRRAIEADPKHANNIGNYADFLANQRRDFDRAEELYRRAIEADPRHANHLGNYANFLANQRGDLDRAEELYRRAIEADPKHANHLGNYALFLENRRGDWNRAEENYRRAIEADPKHGNNLGNYALFLEYRRGDFDGAEVHYRRAIEADPRNARNLGNYATFLENHRGEFDGAQAHYLRAIEADPKDAHWLGAYALFLEKRRGEIEMAEEHYQRAIKTDPKQALWLGSYARFLETRRGDFDRAEELYQRAVEADPKHAWNLGAYGVFLENRRGDFDRAEEHYRRAVEAGPKHARNLGTYANFLATRRGDFDGAEEQYRRAVEADPKHANNFCNFAQFLAGRGQLDKAGPLAERAWELMEGKRDAACAEVVFTRWLLAVVKGGDGNPALGRLKTLLRAGFERGPWSFDKMLAVCVPKLDEAHGRLARKLAEAILDGGKVDELEEEALWRETPAIPLELPWK